RYWCADSTTSGACPTRDLTACGPLAHDAHVSKEYAQMFHVLLFAMMMQAPTAQTASCTPSADDMRTAVVKARTENPKDDKAFLKAADTALGPTSLRDLVVLSHD